MDLHRRFEDFASRMKREVVALYFAIRHKNTPLSAKIIGALTVGYAVSPIDLIPDFIPVLGYLDDLLIVPLGAWITIKLIPPDVWRESQALAAQQGNVRLPKVGYLQK